MQSFGAYNMSALSVPVGYPKGTVNILNNISESATALDAILGEKWTHLKPGDTVDVTLIHVPTNGVLFSKTVTVE